MLVIWDTAMGDLAWKAGQGWLSLDIARKCRLSRSNPLGQLQQTRCRPFPLPPRLALGALTGASMFVTCIVAGRVIRICGGVSARGAQIRDIAFFAAALVLIAIVGEWMELCLAFMEASLQVAPLLLPSSRPQTLPLGRSCWRSIQIPRASAQGPFLCTAVASSQQPACILMSFTPAFRSNAPRFLFLHRVQWGPAG